MKSRFSDQLIATVDSAGNVESFTSVTLSADGLPFISYRDATNIDLKVVHRSAEFCVPFFRRRLNCPCAADRSLGRWTLQSNQLSEGGYDPCPEYVCGLQRAKYAASLDGAEGVAQRGRKGTDN